MSVNSEYEMSLLFTLILATQSKITRVVDHKGIQGKYWAVS
jgi:hypothetical protein